MQECQVVCISILPGGGAGQIVGVCNAIRHKVSMGFESKPPFDTKTPYNRTKYNNDQDAKARAESSSNKAGTKADNKNIEVYNK
ncbi:unnamed protein product, partial [Clavelina lepadiformis]